MLNPRIKRIASLAEKAAGLSLALALVSLPITSLPILSKVTGGTLVAPPALVFVSLAAVLWIPFHVLGRGRLPLEVKPFLLFSAVACLSTLAAFFLPINTYKGHTISGEVVSALVTLASAFIFYIITSTWFQSENQLKGALKLINWGGLAIIIWGLVQIVVIHLMNADYPSWMVWLQDLLSVRSFSRVRVTGFTYEPSWLAHQLNTLYLPFWLAATVTGYTAHQRRLLGLSVENALLAGGIILLIFSFSRIGLLAFLLVMAFLLYKFSVYLARRLVQKMKPDVHGAQPRRLLLEAGVVIGLFALYAGLAVLILFLISRLDPRLARLFSLQDIPANPFDLARQLVFAERLVYWQVGWITFGHYPLLGVGLGNAGFFFEANLPFHGKMLNEILSAINVATYLPNIKSIWVRLLAETGIVGFSVFITWFYTLWSASRYLRDKSSTLRVFGWMGALAVLAYLAEGFSIDSFALPYIWVSLGLITAASAMARRKAHPVKE